MKQQQQQDPGPEPERRSSTASHKRFENDPAGEDRSELYPGEWMACAGHRRQKERDRVTAAKQRQNHPEEQCVIICFNAVDNAATEICPPASGIEDQQRGARCHLEQEAAKEGDAASPQEQRQDEKLGARVEPDDAFVETDGNAKEN